MNNSEDPQTTTITDGQGSEREVSLAANASQWFDFE
ncbi:MAG: 1,3-beta-galactosyl-N-acetylhexosamine phosphorylase C-terminal domain-containing protein [Puniceicoccaceae bacterium]